MRGEEGEGWRGYGGSVTARRVVAARSAEPAPSQLSLLGSQPRGGSSGRSSSTGGGGEREMEKRG